MAGGCNIRFDENDDLVVDDIPDDMMETIERLAAANNRSTEDQMRLILFQIIGVETSPPVAMKSPLP